MSTPNRPSPVSVSGGHNMRSDGAGRPAETGNLPARTEAPHQIRAVDPGTTVNGTRAGWAPGDFRSGGASRRRHTAAGRSNDVEHRGTSDPRDRLYHRVFTLGKPGGIWLQLPGRAERDLDDWRNWPKSTDCG